MLCSTGLAMVLNNLPGPMAASQNPQKSFSEPSAVALPNIRQGGAVSVFVLHTPSRGADAAIKKQTAS